jgi:hypothetical protein
MVTSEDLKSELERDPFSPLRLHLVSGKPFDIWRSNRGFMLQNAVMILRHTMQMDHQEGYDLLSLRNIERIERLDNSGESSPER